jgi:putative tryptophan/tyrosine transport system substrate-binding protein
MEDRQQPIYPFRQLVDVGGPMAYSVDVADVYRIANVINAVLKGANPGDIPFYQQTKFELVMNLKTAKTLGLELPMLFARARSNRRGCRLLALLRQADNQRS